MSGRRIFSSEVRDLFESFEPGLHQFFSIKICQSRRKVPLLNRDGSIVEKPFYLLNATQRLDAVVIEKSNVRVYRYHNLPDLVQQIGSNTEIVLNKSIIGSHHLWTGARHMNGELFFSDVLGHAFNARGWPGVKLTHLREE